MRRGLKRVGFYEGGDLSVRVCWVGGLFLSRCRRGGEKGEDGLVFFLFLFFFPLGLTACKLACLLPGCLDGLFYFTYSLAWMDEWMDGWMCAGREADAPSPTSPFFLFLLLPSSCLV